MRQGPDGELHEAPVERDRLGRAARRLADPAHVEERFADVRVGPQRGSGSTAPRPRGSPRAACSVPSSVSACAWPGSRARIASHSRWARSTSPRSSYSLPSWRCASASAGFACSASTRYRSAPPGLPPCRDDAEADERERVLGRSGGSPPTPAGRRVIAALAEREAQVVARTGGPRLDLHGGYAASVKSSRQSRFRTTVLAPSATTTTGDARREHRVVADAAAKTFQRVGGHEPQPDRRDEEVPLRDHGRRRQRHEARDRDEVHSEPQEARGRRDRPAPHEDGQHGHDRDPGRHEPWKAPDCSPPGSVR